MEKKFFIPIAILVFTVTFACSAEGDYKIKTKTEIHKGTAYKGDYALDVNYPVITNLKDKNAQKLINESIKTFIPNKDSLSSLNYEITYSSENYLCILLKPFVRDDLNGAAHGMPVLFGIMYDLKTGKLLTIDDLFKQGSNYKKYINKIVKQRIDEINFVPQAEFTSIKKDEIFYITEKNLVLCYPPYLYTCFADSPLKIEIPLSDLKPMLKVNL